MIENNIILEKNKIKDKETSILGISGENEQELLIFSFENGFIDGSCFLELEFDCGKKYSIELEKDEEHECYKLEVKRSLLRKEGTIRMQLKIVQGTAVWKSVVFEMFVLEAINASESIEDDYPWFVEQMKVELQELQEGLEQVCEAQKGLRVPSKLSELEDDVGFMTDYEECDPTVPSWAKEPVKPTYTASEVGALPKDTVLFSGDYEDLENKPVIPTIEGLASEEFVRDEIERLDFPEIDEVVVSDTVPDGDWKIWIDESEDEDFVTVQRFEEVVGDIESLLEEV